VQAQLEGLVGAVRGEMAQLSDEADAAQARIQQLEAQLAQAREEAAAATAGAGADGEAWHAELTVTRMEVASLRASLQAMTQERDDALARAAAAETQVALSASGATTEAARLRGEADGLAAQLQAARAEVERLKVTAAAATAAAAAVAASSQPSSPGGARESAQLHAEVERLRRREGELVGLLHAATASPVRTARPPASASAVGSSASAPAAVTNASTTGAAQSSASRSSDWSAQPPRAASRSLHVSPGMTLADGPVPPVSQPSPRSASDHTDPAAAAVHSATASGSAHVHVGGHGAGRGTLAGTARGVPSSLGGVSALTSGSSASTMTVCGVVLLDHTREGGDGGDDDSGGVQVEGLPSASMVRVVDRGMQRLFRLDTVAPSTASAEERFAPALSAVDAAAAVAASPADAGPGSTRHGLVLVACPPTHADTVFRDVAARAVHRLFARLGAEASASPASGSAAVSVSISLLDVYCDSIRDALAVKKAPTPHITAATSAMGSMYTAPTITLPAAAAPTSPAALPVLSATRVEAGSASDGELIIRAGLKSRCLLYRQPGVSTVADEGLHDGSRSAAALLAAAAATRSPHRGHAVAVLRIARRHPVTGQSLPSVKVFLVQVGCPGWVASSVLPLSQGESASLQVESAHLSRTLQCLADCWRQSRANLAHPAEGEGAYGGSAGGADAVTARAARLQALAAQLRSTALTAALADGFHEVARAAAVVVTSERMGYVQDADAVSFLMMANDMCSPSGAAMAPRGAGTAHGAAASSSFGAHQHSSDRRNHRSDAPPPRHGTSSSSGPPRTRPEARAPGVAGASNGAAGAGPTDASALHPRSLFSHPTPGSVWGDISVAPGSGASVAATLSSNGLNAPLFAPPRAGGRRRGSVTRAFLTANGVPPESLPGAGGGSTPGRGRSLSSTRRGSMDDSASLSAAVSVASSTRDGRRRGSIASQGSVVDVSDITTRRVHTGDGTFAVTPAALPMSRTVTEVDAAAGVAEYMDPRLRRLVQDHERRTRAYGARASDPSLDRSAYISLQDYMARNGPAAAVSALVSGEVFEQPQQAARAAAALTKLQSQRPATARPRARTRSRSGGHDAAPAGSVRSRPSTAATSRITTAATSLASTPTIRSTRTSPSPPPAASRPVAHAHAHAPATTAGTSAGTAGDDLDVDAAIAAEMAAQAALAPGLAHVQHPPRAGRRPADERAGQATSSHATPAPAPSPADELLGDPVPGMRRLLHMARQGAARVEGGVEGVIAALASALSAVDAGGSGRVNSDGFALAVGRALPWLSWGDVEAVVDALAIRGLSDIDYGDFVVALQSLLQAGA